MYIEDFEAFYQQSVELYKARPLETRYSIKFRHSEGKLVLKVTDDRTCLKYKTDQQADLRKLERITSIFFPLMACGELPAEGAAGVEAGQQQQQQQAGGTQAAGASSKKARRRG
ncbi:hypothetical protein PLESTB_001164800 [Pleodorina starrii]|uniref:Signal recognition particle 9 kDa protein n=1 Tax=Pleodorina starrii TaxID=330485 RepID=A0A9W6BSX8_9CHLO|nr:hypothetical protein PLESTM_000240500 [Pleodorina starrii]GLC56931.1 hypothetical protein PLESTB_001164800 [Pleodorina starrii]GLC64767.1 hypothetical protein PLESTF_000205200 [Pleodorina starrii]